MKKMLLLACVAGLGLSACSKKTQCPAYSSTKDATRISSSLTAQHGSATEQQ